MNPLLLLHHSYPPPLLRRSHSSRHLKSFFVPKIIRATPNHELRYGPLIVMAQSIEDEKVQTTDEYPVGFPSHKRGTCYIHAFLLDFWIISEYLCTPRVVKIAL